jgi:hopene-associated glycosyltransferase HpnB
MSWLSIATGLALLTWLYLLFCHHGFWRAGPRLSGAIKDVVFWSEIVVVMPARDEAEVIETAIRSILNQSYPGRCHLIVVDDESTDGTGAIVEGLRSEAGPRVSLELVVNSPRPQGWSGKLWAVATGLDQAKRSASNATYVLLTDADIAHAPTNFAELVSKAVDEELELVSLMVKLRSESPWERLLIPPFVFFFQMLYPFPAVNDPRRAEAAAAGGCVLVRRDVLDAAGGISAIRGALIDDVALGRLIKDRDGGSRRLWLGLDERTQSIRPYESLAAIWTMVARTADTQLGHSLLWLLGTVVGLCLVYLLAPLAVLAWPAHHDLVAFVLGAIVWCVMAIVFWPTLALYRQSWLWTLSLPLAALFYLGMTLFSAWQYRNGRCGLWKGRVASE